MRKKTHRKLVLNRETLLQLNDLKRARGAATDNGSCATNVCPRATDTCECTLPYPSEVVTCTQGPLNCNPTYV